MAEDRGPALAARLLEGVDALRARRLVEAEAALRDVACDAELAAADDLRDVRSRALALWAQALIALDRLDEAEPAARDALAVARALDDPDAATEARHVWEQLASARDAARQRDRHQAAATRLRALDPQAIRDRYGADPRALCDVLTKKANAEADGGNLALAARLSEEALATASELADAGREEVLALLSLARARPAEAAALLDLAWRRASRDDDFNLVGAVGRALRAHGLPEPTQIGPDLGRKAREDAPDGDR